MVLIISLVMLVILTLLGISAMSTTTLEERMAANLQEQNRSFQAAETGLDLAFTDPGSFSGTTTGYANNNANNNIGSYSADTGYASNYRDSVDLTYTSITSASSAGTFKWHYFDITSTGATDSGASTTLGAGAKVLGT